MKYGRKRNLQVINRIKKMELVQQKWQSRIIRAEEELVSSFRFKNKKAPVVIVDSNYWTFGDLLDEIPSDHYTEPSSVFRYQMDKIERHFNNVPDDAYIPFLHPWYGTGVLASAFGIELIINPKADPAVDIPRMQHPEEIDLLTFPVAGESGAMPVVIKIMDYLMAHSDLPVVFTDCQGPLTTAFQIAGYDKMCYWMYEDPYHIHKLMNMITDALIAWVRFQKKHARQSITGDSYPLSVKLPAGYGGVWMSDDDSVIISSDLYNEFVRPYNEKLLAAFGGGCIHYCGNSTQNIENYCNTIGVTAINNFNLDDLEAASKIRRALREKGIVYMACDFTPADHRIEEYYRELSKVMDGPEGLIVCSYIAPAIALDRGKYEALERDREVLSRKAFELISKYF
jgi:uroporphyrinogen-III decarboxylase